MSGMMDLVRFAKFMNTVKVRLGIADLTEIWFVLIGILCAWNLLMEQIGTHYVAVYHTGVFAMTALLAAYKIRLLGAIQERLDVFEKENQKLEESVSKLQALNDTYIESNSELKNNVDLLRQESGNLHMQIDKLHQTISDLDTVRQVMEGFAAENNKDLGAVMENMRSAIGDQKNLLKGQQQILSKTKEATKNQEKLMLLQLQSQLQFQDQQAGLSRTEYDSFVSLLPDVFRDHYNRLNPTFETWDTNKDGNIDMMEFQNLINTLLEDHDSGIQGSLDKQLRRSSSSVAISV